MYQIGTQSQEETKNIFNNSPKEKPKHADNINMMRVSAMESKTMNGGYKMILHGHVILIGEGFVSVECEGREIHIETEQRINVNSGDRVAVVIMDDVTKMKRFGHRIENGVMLIRCNLSERKDS